jgi:hypothetical protein
MAAPKLGFLDYVKAAFRRKVPVPGLGAMPLNPLALGVFAVLGIANPGFWLLGLAAELGYLFALSSSPRFQKLVDAERLVDAQSGWEDRVHLEVGKLTDESRRRYEQVLAQCRRILGISETLDGSGLGGVRGLRSSSLNQLLMIFLRLLRSRELIGENLQGVDRKDIQAEAQRIESRLGQVDRAKDAALARSLEGTLEIQKRRLANLDRARTSLAVIDAELARIEHHVELIREESAVSGKPEVLSDRLDAVTSAMGETTRWMADNAEFFGALGADEAVAVPSDLPRLPASEEER